MPRLSANNSLQVKEKEIAAVKEGLLRQIHELSAVIEEQEGELRKHGGNR